MNKYVDEDEPDVDLHEYDPETQVKQVQSLRRVKAERNDSEVSRRLTALERVARAKQKRHASPGRLLQGLLHGGRDGRRFQTGLW